MSCRDGLLRYKSAFARHPWSDSEVEICPCPLPGQPPDRGRFEFKVVVRYTRNGRHTLRWTSKTALTWSFPVAGVHCARLRGARPTGATRHRVADMTQTPLQTYIPE